MILGFVDELDANDIGRVFELCGKEGQDVSSTREVRFFVKFDRVAGYTAVCVCILLPRG